jgi:hypothetical protein
LDVPSVNFLGATDDGYGHWINNTFINLGAGDGVHPNDAGHYEMFLTIVPSVFDALKEGKPTPHWGSRSRYLRLVGDTNHPAPLSLSASLMHSFTLSFRVRATGIGTVASIELPAASDHATVEITATGLAYISANGSINNSGVSGTNGAWHDVVVAHQYARGLTFFYVDGLPAAPVQERLTPVGFVLGGPGTAATHPASPAQADYQDWFVHRSMMNQEEVTAQFQGKLQQASLELYAPLNDSGFTTGATNLAQSLDAVTINGATNASSVIAMTPPTNLVVSSNDTPAVMLSWTDPAGTSEDAYYVERSTSGGAWTNVAVLSAHANNYADLSVKFGTNYQYRVSYANAGLRSDYLMSDIFHIRSTNHFSADTILIDFGRNDGGVNGAPTASPDANGNYWNNMGGSGDAQTATLNNLVTVDNSPTAVSASTVTTFEANGIQNGGLLSPDASLLGDFAINTATEDYWFVQGTGASATLRLAGLNPSLKYNLSMFATRDNASTRITQYSVTDVNGLHSVNVQTSGSGSGSAAHPTGNDDTIVSLNGLTPNGSGQLDLTTKEITGGFAYLGILKITPVDQPLVFVVNPQSAAVAIGSTVTLTAVASSSQPVNYQWYFANNALAGITGTNLVITNISNVNAGNYFVVASNILGVVTSAVATVTIGPPHLPRASVLIDFGRHDGGVNGEITISPDANGNYWNNMGSSSDAQPQGLSVTNIVTVDDIPTTIGLTALTDTWRANGILNGGLISPDYALLGDFAVGTVTEDYFYVQDFGSGATATLRLNGLDPSRTYNLSMFATRDTSTVRITEYAVTDVNGLHSVNLQVSGPGSGTSAHPNANDDSVVSLNGLVPNASGQLDLVVTEITGGYAYLGALEIIPAPVARFMSPTRIGGGWQLQFSTIPGYTYHVQRAPEITGPWTDIGTISSSGDGLCVFEDTDAPAARAFYRTVIP